MKQTRKTRRGTAAVEAALLLPLVVLVSLGAIDIAQYINLAQLVANASRDGARIASRSDTETIQEVETALKQFLKESTFSMNESDIAEGLTVAVTYGPNNTPVADGDLSEIPSGEQVTITVGFDFSVVRWLKGPNYWNGSVNDSTSYFRRE